MEQTEIHSILQLLPHRYPFLLLDRITHLVPGESITALKNVTINEPFFPGHFPEQPIMPGVLIIEALGQACGILAFKSAEAKDPQAKRMVLLAGVDETRFKKVVIPGDQLILKAKILRVKHGIWKCEANAFVDEQLACSAILLGAIKEVARD